MKEIREILQQALQECLKHEGWDLPVRVEFSRRQETAFACAALLPLGKNAPAAADRITRVFARKYPDLAQLEAQAGWLQIVPSRELLAHELERITRIDPEEPSWEEPYTPFLLRLRAVRAFGEEIPFDEAAAMALLRLTHHLPYTRELLTQKLHPTISRALETVCRQERIVP